MKIYVSYLRQLRGDKDNPDKITGNDIAEIRHFWVSYPWDPEHPLEYRPAPAPGPWGF